MNTPLLSIIIPVFNVENYLRECLDSLLQQDLTACEVLCVNDGSTDGSLAILHEYQAAHLDVFRVFTQTNQGQAAARNKALDEAKGEFVVFLDSDDYYLPNALNDSVGNIQEHLDCVLSFSRFYMCDESLNKTGKCRRLDLKGKSYFENRDYCPEHFVAFKKEAYDKTAGIDSMLQAGVDQDLYFRMEEVGGVAVMDKFTYLYRQNSTALTFTPYWCYYWNTIVRHNTCMRRGIPVKDYAYADYLELVTEEKIIAEKQIHQIRSSKAYRLGKILLRPFKWLRK
ncbi:MAG: glycosyltransferase family 2 protein [Alistipes sp.]|nr:glycosyltransferase family 2 protein [Alistipes sp.]MBR6550655.1 glycosyltransferase family 2 protein [Paludibacteraceae bacterium]